MDSSSHLGHWPRPVQHSRWGRADEYVRHTGTRLRSAGADLGEDFFGVGVLAGSFPGVDEVAIHHYLEHPASRGDDQQF
jgi:hypothetical protein